MANVIVERKNLEDIADAIREKSSTTGAYKPSEMSQAIKDIPSGGDNTKLSELIARTIVDFVVPDSVTSIGNYAFYYCENLTSITIPDSVTSIGSAAFYHCSNLTSITIPNSVISIGDYAFYHCSNLTSITIPNGVTSIDYSAFNECENLKSITISNSVTSIGEYVFSFCTSLTSITIPNSVISIGEYVFNYCENLQNVIIENGFNSNNLDLSPSTKYTKETIVSWLNALADRTGQTAYTLTIGSTNLTKLTAEDIAIATNKNWTLA